MGERQTKVGPGGERDALRGQGGRAEWREIETALRRQSEELQTILDSVPAFIWFKDAENRILRANRLAAESMGTTTRALEGRSTYDLYPEEAASYHRDDLEVIRSGQAKLGIVEPLTTSAGEKLWVRTDKVPYRNPAGEVVGVLVFAVDITERVRAEEALREAHDLLEARVAERTADLAAAVENLRREIAERERAEEKVREQEAELAHLLRLRTVEGMAAQLAHEINQPLSAIVNFARGLARRLSAGVDDPSGALRATEQIGAQAMRAADIVARLRDFVRKEPPRRQLCDLGDVVREAVSLIAADARRRRLALRLEIEPGLPPVEIDRIQIEQVVLNLLRNALEACEERAAADAVVRVRVHAPEAERLAVVVSDSGSGFVPSDSHLMFEPFFTTKKNGLGMGLSISRSIVAAHGGAIEGRPNDGGGAVFSFTLPAARRGA